MDFLISRRPKEELVLSLSPKVYVSEQIVQYLALHQINGIRFLFKNVKNKISCFLNDDKLVGKCFQIVSLLRALFTSQKTALAIVITSNKQELTHFIYHCMKLLPNTTIGQNEIKTNANDADGCVCIFSLSNFNQKLHELRTMHFNYLIVYDHNLELNSENIASIGELQADVKIIANSEDLLDNTRYFYDMLRLTNHLNAFESKRVIQFDDFAMKFGCEDKSLSKRNLLFRQKNLINICTEFYLRRRANQTANCIPLIDKSLFEKHFQDWQRCQSGRATHELDESWFESDMEVPSSMETQPDRTIASDNRPHENVVIELSSQNADEFHSELDMSPLVYEGSDSEDETLFETNSTTHKEETDKKKEKPKSTYQSPCQSNDNPKQKIAHENVSEKRVLRSRRQIETTHAFRSTGSKNNEIKNESGQSTKPQNSKVKVTKINRKESVESSRKTSSEVEIIDNDSDSPIVISSGEIMEQRLTQAGTSNASPDLFSSIAGSQPNASAIKMFSSQSEDEDIPKSFSKLGDVAQSTPRSQRFKSADTETPNIFEITTNNQFSNVLSVRDRDTVTPLTKDNIALREVRVLLPRLTSQDLKHLRPICEESEEKLSSSTTDTDFIDLTSNNRRKVEHESIRTPKRKLQLSPSTRSCVKRAAILISSDEDEDNQQKGQSQSAKKSDWLKKENVNKTTPRSRRLQSWLKANASLNEPKSGIRPRNLFQ